MTSNIVESEMTHPFTSCASPADDADRTVAAVVGEIGQPGQAAEIADVIISLMRIYGNLKSRLANTPDPEIAALFLLVQLVKNGPKRAKELAELTSADPSTVSRQVATLVKNGLIERKADPEDGRASILVPTAFGVSRVREHFVNRGQMIEPMIADWSTTDRSDFLRLLRRYTDQLESRREEVLDAMCRTHNLQPLPHRLPAQHSSPQPHPHASTERSN
jgi:DNA-binding MarR family transcriptional regulator